MTIPLPLFLLHSLLWALLTSLEYSHALIYDKPSKTPIELDLDGNIPDLIQVTPSTFHRGGLSYIIDPNYDEWYRIGDVIYDGELILEDHIMNEMRLVLLVPQNDVIYLEVVNVYKGDDGKTMMEMDEFFKRLGSSTYRPVVRLPIELDMESEEYRSLFTIDESMEGIKRYAVQGRLRFYFVMGKVRVGRHIMDNTVDGVVDKKVVCSQLTQPNTCTITMVMKDMTISRKLYRIEQDGRITLVETMLLNGDV